MGAAAGDMPGFRSVRECKAYSCSSGIQSPLRGCEPGDIDWVIVRENSEGEYSGLRRCHQGHPGESCYGGLCIYPSGGNANYAVCLLGRAVAPKKDVNHGYKIQCAEAWHGDVGRDSS